jgi:hypothetical protein
MLICALLDRRNRDEISYQEYYRQFKDDAVVRSFVNFFSSQAHDAFRAVDKFELAYCQIDFKRNGPLSRLQHLRNRGDKPVEKSVTYDELGLLVKQVTNMAEALSIFAPNEFCVTDCQEMYRRGRVTWNALGAATS